MHLIKNFYIKYKDALDLRLVGSEKTLKRTIKIPEAQRPGLRLSGYFNGYNPEKMMIFGKTELDFLRLLSDKEKHDRLSQMLTPKVPGVVVTRNYRPPEEISTLCEKNNIPLFRSKIATHKLFSRLTILLAEEFSETTSYYATFVEVFDVGMLIKGDSSVGKSETALGLIERGHRLISDDIVKVTKKEQGFLEGSSPDLIRNHMEIRGIGIIDIAKIYGIRGICDRKVIDVAVQLEIWNEQVFYDRVGIEENLLEIVGIKIPLHIVPLKPGRDVALLIEMIALNHRLKKMGYHSAKEFREKVAKAIEQRSKENSISEKFPNRHCTEQTGITLPTSKLHCEVGAEASK